MATEELYIGEYLTLGQEQGLLGIVREIKDNTILVEGILTGNILKLEKGNAEMMRVDLKRTLMRQLIGMLSELPKGYTMNIMLTNRDGEQVLSQGYTGGEDDRISNN